VVCVEEYLFCRSRGVYPFHPHLLLEVLVLEVLVDGGCGDASDVGEAVASVVVDVFERLFVPG